MEGEQEGEILPEGEPNLEGESVEGEEEGEMVEEGEGEGENEASVGCCRRQSAKTENFAGDGLLLACTLCLFVIPRTRKRGV